MISIIVPSYGRPERVASVVSNIRDSMNGYAPRYEIMVVVEDSEIAAYADALGYITSEDGSTWLVTNELSTNYAGAVNTAVKYARGDLYMIAADDLTFHTGWAMYATRNMNALPSIKVVGTNDLLNDFVLQGYHATHYLVAADYIWDIGGVVDEAPGQVLHEGYTHNFVDTEFIGTAKARAVFVPCLEAVVEHNHFTAGKSDKDSTYDKGYANLQEDADLYYARRHLWWDISK